MLRLALAFLLALPVLAQPNQIVAIAHRGDHQSHPENTLAAYQAAIDAGADFFETDVRTTADGKLVIMHDSKVDRTTNGHGEVSKLTFDEIRKLQPPVPTFDEVLALARRRIGVYIDAKDISAEALMAAVEKHGMEDQVVIYGRFELLHEIRKRSPRLKVMPESVSVPVVKGLIETMQPKVIAFSRADFTPEIIALAKAAGADIYVDRMGLTDNPAGWQEAIDLGATGIQTDRPRDLVEYLRSKGYHK